LSKIVLLRISVIAGLLGGFALSPKLWVSSRLYPLTPVFSFIKPFTSPGDYVVFYTLIALLVAAAIVPRREILIAVFVLLVLLVLQDQSRLQPWFYQYTLMLLAIALAGPDRPAAALNTCCLIVAATYVWSGLAKLNPSFIGDIFPFLVKPFIGSGNGVTEWLARHLGFVAALLECALGVGLLIKRSRSLAVFFAIAMHVFILVAIGPLGRGVNAVVWPWNVAMIAFLLILFFRRADDPAPRDIIWGREVAFQKIVLVLFALMPMLSFFNLWDHYLSSALYSGNRNSGVVYLSDPVFDRLPDTVEDYVTEEGPNRNKLDIFDWSLGELNVPSYPEIRVFKNVAREICRYASEDPSVELVVQGKLALVDSNRRYLYHCSGLTRIP
jgi:hypothetical protein